MEQKEIVYLGVFLTPESRLELLHAFGPIHEKVTAEHMTIAFKPSKLEVENAPIGKTVRLKVVGYAVSSKSQAVRVYGVLSKNEHPHVTISFDSTQVNAAYSNELMVQQAGGILYNKELYLTGVIDTFPRTPTASPPDFKDTANG
jgi:hypothetical protein